MNIQQVNNQPMPGNGQVTAAKGLDKCSSLPVGECCNGDLSVARFPPFDDGQFAERAAVSKSLEKTSTGKTGSFGSNLLWRVSTGATAITTGLSVYLGGVTMILARQIERAHCVECWLTKVLPASLLVGIGGYLVSRLDRKSIEKKLGARQKRQEQSEESGDFE